MLLRLKCPSTPFNIPQKPLNVKRRYCSTPSTGRKPLQWQHPDFHDEKKLEQEMRRVFDVCHGCRACFNLCDSFPSLFKLIDSATSNELDTVPSSTFKDVSDKCTLCDLCYMSSCPYVPPHPLNIDFPHLILRYRAVEKRKNDQYDLIEDKEKQTFYWPHKDEVHKTQEGISTQLTFDKTKFREKLLTNTDFLASIAAPFSSIVNKMLTPSSIARKIMEKVLQIDQRAYLPQYVPPKQQLINLIKKQKPISQQQSPRKVIIYTTCLSNYNSPKIGLSAKNILEHSGVEVIFKYKKCCGMPKLEGGDLPAVAESAKEISDDLIPLIKEGYQVISVVASCSLMMKKEWPLILPDNENIDLLSKNVFDVSEYIVNLNKKKELNKEGLTPLDGSIALHNACHAKAQNIGFKSAEMLRIIPKAQINAIGRCSGHGGSWGVMKDNFDVALKVGKPAIDLAVNSENKAINSGGTVHYVTSDCPLASLHILQGMELSESAKISKNAHPVELLARSYGLHPDQKESSEI